jgi:hypothetical protein
MKTIVCRAVIAVAAVALVASGALVAPASATAAAPNVWTNGEFESDQFWVNDPWSGESTLKTGAMASASWMSTTGSGTPDKGQPFWAKITVGFIGAPSNGVSKTVVAPEFILPRGVDYYTGGNGYTVAWRMYNTAQSGEPAFRTDELGSTTGQNGGEYIMHKDAAGNLQGWEIRSGWMLDIVVPVVTSRELLGVATPPPTCLQRRQRTGACSPAESGDHLQVAVKLGHAYAPAFLIPYVGMYATAPAVTPRPGAGNPVPTPGATTTLTVPKKVKAGKKVTLKVKASTSGTVTVLDGKKKLKTLKVKKGKTYKVTVKKFKKGKHTITVRLKPTSKSLPVSSKKATIIAR